MALQIDEVDATWLGSKLGRTVAEIEKQDITKAGGGYSGNLVLIRESSHCSFVAKSTSRGREQQGKTLGLAREALFYDELAPFLVSQHSELLPRILYAKGDMESGRRLVVMEDFTSSGVQSGYFFGPGSPLNHGKDLAAVTRGWKLSPDEITTMAFTAAAQLHASFWRREDILLGTEKGRKWLRGAEWLRGSGKESWLASQKFASAHIANIVKTSSSAGEGGVKWDPTVLACLLSSRFARSAAMGQEEREAEESAAWEEYQSSLSVRPFTLVHGDFHPGNMMICDGSRGTGTEGYHVVMLDFEQVGVGSGPQDLGQFMISHTEPSLRASIEERAVRDYYQKLCAANQSISSGLSWEACWEEYVKGGLARWMWMLPVLSAMCPPPVTQYFQDQVAAFVETHGITGDSCPMPRV